MAGVAKISGLPGASTLTGGELFEIVQGGANRQGTLAMLSTLYGRVLAVADGSDITSALAAAAVLGGAITLPAGDYISDSVTFPVRGTHVRPQGRVVIVAKDTMSSVSHLWTFTEDDCSVEGIEFEGKSYSAFGDTIYPYSLVRFESAGGATTVGGGRVKWCKFTGGQNGILPRNVSDFSAFHNRLDHQYTVGISNLDGCTNGKFMFNTVRWAGVNSGIVVGTFARATDTNNVIGFNTIEDCGRLDPDTTQWQEGIDLFATSTSYTKVTTNIIRRCGNGGVEMKTSNTGLAVLPQFYGKIEIELNIVEVDQDLKPGIVCNWTTAYATPNKAMHVVIRNNTQYYTGVSAPTGTSSSAIIVNAYTDTEISYNRSIGFYCGVNLIGDGSSDATNRRTRITGEYHRGGTYGINGNTGTLENVTITLCDIEMEAYAITLTNAAVTDAHIIGNLRLVATSNILGSVYAIHLKNDTGTVIEGNKHVESYHEAIYGNGGNVSATVSGNKLISRSTHCARFDNYAAVDYFDNECRPASNLFRAHKSTGTVSGAMNWMGMRAAIPTGAGSVGDAFRAFPPAAGVMGWGCSVAGDDTVATWVVI